MKTHVCIVAGDLSGDEHAAAVAKALKQSPGKVTITALGGSCLQSIADCFLGNIVDLNVFGFFAPFKALGTLRRMLKLLRARWDECRPDVVMLVDYYGFNIHVARAAYRRGIPVYYYISPQVWASRPGRIARLKRYVTRMLVILPFEEQLYASHGVPATFVGHPLLDRLPAAEASPVKPPVVGIFPGSRRSYFKRHMPILLEAAARIRREVPGVSFVFFVVPSLATSCVNLPGTVVTIDPGFEQRRKISLAVTTSGTVSVENALLGIPMLVMYRLSWFNYLIARLLVNVRYITMANILAGREIVPEFIQGRARPELIAAAAIDLLQNPTALSRAGEDVRGVRRMLGEPGVAGRVARIILESRT